MKWILVKNVDVSEIARNMPGSPYFKNFGNMSNYGGFKNVSDIIKIFE